MSFAHVYCVLVLLIMRVVFSFFIVLVVLLRASFESEENEINFNFNDFKSLLTANDANADSIDKNIAEDSKLDTVRANKIFNVTK